MNILFVLYDGYHSNSATFVASYANALVSKGHKVAISVPDIAPEFTGNFERHSFQRVLHSQIAGGFAFSDGTSPHVVHAWTPRENVRKAAFGCVANTGARLVVHLEDNEHLVTSSILGKSKEELRDASERDIAKILPDTLSHPRLADIFIGAADAVTVVWPSLHEFVPAGTKKHHLLMCPDPVRLRSPASSKTIAARLGIRHGENLIVYSGHLNSVNQADQSTLYRAIVLLNEQNVPCRLIRTGPNTKGTAEILAPGSSPYVVEAGLLNEEELAAVMRLATVFVQPGQNDLFNRYRMPCKIPEFLYLGCPVVIPGANIAEWMTDKEDALILQQGTAEEIAAKCRQVFETPALREKLATAAQRFAQKHLGLQKSADELLFFYQDICEIGPRAQVVKAGGDMERNFLALAMSKCLEKKDTQTAYRIAEQISFGFPVALQPPLNRRQRLLKILWLIRNECIACFR